MIMVNGKTVVGYRLDEVTADGPVGMEMLANPFAIVPKLENAQRIEEAFRLLERWAFSTPYFETKAEWEAWVAEFRPKVEAVVHAKAKS